MTTIQQDLLGLTELKLKNKLSKLLFEFRIKKVSVIPEFNYETIETTMMLNLKMKLYKININY